MVLLQQLLNGLAVGSIYSLLSLGFTLVYGVLYLQNMPHGEVLMVGTFIGYVLYASGVPFGLALVVAMIGAAFVGVLVERIAYRRLRNARRLAPLLSALGVVFALQNGALAIWGTEVRSFPQPAFFSKIFDVYGIRVPSTVVFILALSVVLMIVLQLFFKKHPVGISIRAVSDDIETAKLMGINTNLAIAVTFAVGSALAAAAGIMLAVRYGPIHPLMGFGLMLKSFAICVLGGIGNIYGAVMGSFILGIAEVIAVGYVSPAYKEAIGFAVLIVTLVFLPTGIFRGRAEVRL